MEDKQAKIDPKTHAILKKFAAYMTRKTGIPWGIKNAITHLVRTHPEIAKPNDDKEV